MSCLTGPSTGLKPPSLIGKKIDMLAGNTG